MSLAQTLKVVAEELQQLARALESGTPSDQLGEINPPVTTYTWEAYGAIYDLLKQDGEL